MLRAAPKILIKPDIKQLIAGVALKDEKSFNQLFDLYYPKLIQIALTYVPGISAAQEIVSEVFYKILRNPQNLARVSDFNNYIFIAVRNQANSYLRKNRKFLNAESLDANEDYIFPTQNHNPEDSLISDELYELIYDFIQQLPPKRKIIFQLVKEERMKYREVAQLLEISIKTVEIQMSLALNKLRGIISDYQQSLDIKIKRIERHR